MSESAWQPTIRRCAPGCHKFRTFGAWGVVFGLSRCELCDKIATEKDLRPTPEPDPPQ